jgi:hypothetical protein
MKQPRLVSTAELSKLDKDIDKIEEALREQHFNKLFPGEWNKKVRDIEVKRVMDRIKRYRSRPRKTDKILTDSQIKEAVDASKDIIEGT